MEQVHSRLYKFKNQVDAQNDPKTHTVLGIAENCIVRIDPELVQRLGIRDGDIVSEVEDGTGTIKLIFKDIKNRNGRPEAAQQPDDQNYDE